jgi:hypothetical protein
MGSYLLMPGNLAEQQSKFTFVLFGLKDCGLRIYPASPIGSLPIDIEARGEPTGICRKVIVSNFIRGLARDDIVGSLPMEMFAEEIHNNTPRFAIFRDIGSEPGRIGAVRGSLPHMEIRIHAALHQARMGHDDL